jgi:hypothetical protein
MNKLYAFLALVFLTACGSPLDGTWSGTGDAENYAMEVSGEEATLIDVADEESTSCTVESPGESKSNVICTDGDDSFTLVVSVDGDTMTAQEEGDDDVATFVKE